MPVSHARAPWAGLCVAVLLVVAAFVVPAVTGWEVWARAPRSTVDHGAAPLHGYWEPKALGPGTPIALALAVLGWRFAPALAQRLSWRGLLATSYAVGLAWLLALALVDGTDGLARTLGSRYEYLPTARDVTDVSALLHGYVERIPSGQADSWPTHVAGHPPAALLFFVGLVRLGLGGDLAAGLVVTATAASTTAAVLVTLRALGAEDAGRRAAPFLTLAPAAVFMAVSADAVFAAVAAWGLAALALGATSAARAREVGWSVLAGLLLGGCVMLSYGLPLLGLLALAVLVRARSWWPLPVAALAATSAVLAFAAGGFAWWEAFPVLRERYWDGIAADRPAAYWTWANLAALLVCTGPLIGAGLAVLRRGSDRTVRLLAGAAATTVLLADLSQMSKAEVERIWLPFVPWLMLVTALLPERWRRWGLLVQVAWAIGVQQLLYTSW